MRCKIMRFQKFMWCNMMRSTKSQKTSILHYSVDIDSAKQTRPALMLYYIPKSSEQFKLSLLLHTFK